MMIVRNKIHDRSQREKFCMAIKELREVMAAKGITRRRAHLLYERLKEYKKMTIPLVAEKENCNNKNTKSIEMLEKKMDELAQENAFLRNDKRYKSSSDDNSIIEIESLLKELENKNASIVKEKHKLECEKDLLVKEIERLSASCESMTSSVKENMVPLSTEMYEKLSFLEGYWKEDDLCKEIEAYRQKILHLNKEVAVLMKNNRNLESEKNVLSEKLKIVESSISKEGREDEATGRNIIQDELNSVIEGFKKALASSKDLEKQLECINRKSEALYAENAELKNKIKLTEDCRLAIAKEKRRCEGMREEIKQKEAHLCDLIKEIREGTERNQIAANEFREKYLSTLKKVEYFEKKIEDYEEVNKKLKDEASAAVSQATLSQNIIKRQEMTICALKRKCAISDNEEVDEDIEMYRKIVRCSLCDSNIKDCVISECMHCFCEECLIGQFKSRKRRCPTCEKGFNIKDLKKIYL